MPNYSTLLGLTKPIAGEDNGSWGTTVNDGITQLIEDSVAGTTTISTDANVTLTTTQGASNQARAAIILCTGARTAARTITAPAASKTYIVVNNTTGGYGVNFVGVGPTAGVLVGPNSTAMLAWNGSDFVTVNNTVYANSSGDALRITQAGSGNALLVEDATSPDTTPMIIDTNGRVISGHTASISATSGLSPQIASVGTTNSTASMGIARFSNDTAQGYLSFTKSRSTTVGTYGTIAGSADAIGTIIWTADDGTATPAQAASITGWVNGTPGASDMPGMLTFNTSPDGTAAPTEKMRITNDGKVAIGSTNTTSTAFRVSKTITGATTAYGSFIDGAIQSDVTVNGIGSHVSLSTAAASFTSSLRGFSVSAAAPGAGSKMSSLVGYFVPASFNNGSTTYGFNAANNVATARTITNVELTSNVVTITTSVAHGFVPGQTLRIQATTTTAVNGDFVVDTTPTTTTFTYALVAADIASVADTGSITNTNVWGFYTGGNAPNFVSPLIAGTAANQLITPSGFGQPPVQITTTNTGGALIHVSAAGTIGGHVHFMKSRGASVNFGGQTAAVSGDTMGVLSFWGHDGSTFVRGAAIQTAVDTTVSTGLVQGRIEFYTANSAGTQTQAMRINSSQQVHIGGGAPVGGVSLGIGRTVTGGTTAYSVNNTGQVQSDVTSTVAMYRSIPSTVAAAFTLTNLRHFTAVQGTIGAGSAVSNQVAFFVDASLSGATNNYAFYSDLAVGPNSNWNLYMAGAARNYLAGKLSIGQTTDEGILSVRSDSSAAWTGMVLKNRVSATNTESGVRMIAGAFDHTDARYAEVSGINENASSAIGLSFKTANGATPAERMRINAAGQVLVGATFTARANVNGNTPQLQVEGLTTNASSISATRNSADTNGSAVFLAKSRGGAVGSNTVVVSGDTLGQVTFNGADGTNLIQAATIRADVDATPGTNDMPGRLVFATTADGSSSATDRMIISQHGGVAVGSTSAANGRTLVLNKDMSGSGGFAIALSNQGFVTSAVTSSATYYYSAATLDTGANLTDVRHFYADQSGWIGTATNQYGFLVENSLTSATNNFGFRSNILSGANRWNFYAAGTAANHFTGATTFGAKLGYGTTSGVGGTVTQITNKGTGVTLNTPTGQITMEGTAALAASTTVTFTLTNSTIEANDNIVVHRKSGGTAGAYQVWCDSVAAGSCVIAVRNTTGGSLSEAPVLQFSVIKGAIA